MKFSASHTMLLLTPALLVTLWDCPAVAAPDGVREVTLSDEELEKLDRFEEHTLAKADQAFSKEQYRQARAEYNSFIVEFPRSRLIPYTTNLKHREDFHDVVRRRGC